MMRPLVPIASVLLLLLLPGMAMADERYAVRGMVLQVDVPARRFVASIERIPGFMEAMAMPFHVRTAAELAGVVAGAIVEFTLVVSAGGSYVEDLHVRSFQSVEQDPLAARRLALLKRVTSGKPSPALAVGEPVPDVGLIDHKGRSVSLARFRGKVIAVNFMYTTCQLPDFCLRLVNHFGALQRQFAGSLGRDLVFLTLTFDPVRDQPDVLDAYARQWDPDPEVWRFLTGAPADVQRVLDWFGVSAFSQEGLMDHSLHTVLIDRTGRMAANIEGNEYSTDQLGDLIRSLLASQPAAPPPDGLAVQ
jgi:protein SCO1/2